MKKSIPKWVVGLVLALGVGAIILVALTAGNTQELVNPNPPAKVIPRYIFETMSKEAQDQMIKDGVEVVDEVQQPEGIPGQGAPDPERT